MYKKPPLGLKPKRIHDEQRLYEVQSAIARRYDAEWSIPIEWVEEYNQLISMLKENGHAKKPLP
jgi:hypothetical protein